MQFLSNSEPGSVIDTMASLATLNNNGNNMMNNFNPHSNNQGSTGVIVSGPEITGPADPSGDAPAAIIESNPNVLNAEIDFMSTPLSQQYLAGSSDAIKNIQAKCADDYITKCLVPNVPTGAEMSVSQIGTTLTKVMLPRRLITADEFTNTPLLSFKQQVKKASDVANLVFKKSPTIPENSILRKPSADQKKLIEHRTNVLEHHQNKFKTQVEEVRHLRENGDKHNEDMMHKDDKHNHHEAHHGGPDDHHSDHEDEMRHKDEHEEDKEDEKEHLEDHDHHDHHDHDHGSEDDMGHDDHDHDHHHHPEGKPPCRHKHMDTYQGSLGYGVQGDQCMLSHRDDLSETCGMAINDLYALRSQYVDEYRSEQAFDGPPHHGPPSMIVPVFFLLLLVIFFVRKLYRLPYRKYRKQQINSVLSAIESNPTLKAAVEAETGFALPEKFHNEGSCTKRMLCRSLLRVLGVVFTCLFLAATAVMVTAHIIMAHYDATGDVPPPFAAGLMILGILMLEIGAVFLMYKGIRFMLSRGSGNQAAATQPQYTSSSSSVDDNDDSGTSAAHQFGRRIRYVYNDYFGRLSAPGTVSSSSRSHAQSGLYAPLNSNDVVYAPTAPNVYMQPSVIATTPVHVQPSQQGNVYYASGSAAPVSHVHMI